MFHKWYWHFVALFKTKSLNVDSDDYQEKTEESKQTDFSSRKLKNCWSSFRWTELHVTRAHSRVCIHSCVRILLAPLYINWTILLECSSPKWVDISIDLQSVCYFGAFKKLGKMTIPVKRSLKSVWLKLNRIFLPGKSLENGSVVVRPWLHRGDSDNSLPWSYCI